MADYFAVLQRTLSGFSDPKPELRTKLYERARSTIERQLASRTPPVTGEALTLEMGRLEQAIVDIEGQYAPAVVEQPTEIQPEPTPVTQAPTIVEAVPASVPITESPAQPEQMPAAEISPEPVAISEQQTPVAAPVVEIAPEPQPEVSQPEQEPEPVPAPPLPEPVDAPPPIPIFDAPAPEPVAEPAPAPEPVAEPAPAPDPIPDLALEIPTLPLSTPQPPAAENPPVAPAPVPVEQSVEAPVASQNAAPNDPAVEAVEAWAKEFLAHEPEQTPPPQPTLVTAEAVAPVAPAVEEQVPQSAPVPQFSEHIEHLVPQAPEPQPTAVENPAAHELPAFDPVADDSLEIPPAPGFSPRAPRRSKKRRGLKWLLILIFMGAIAAGGYFGWQSRATLIETFGLSKWFVDPQDPQTPKKVKTIIIKPDPVEPEAQPAQPDKPKAETRIPVQGAATDADQTEIKPVSANAAPPVSQNAVLYEEGATAADSSIDKGRVVWSVVQQAPLEGLPVEPAIQGRVEVPSRQLVLNMTIKRNADKSLPASHVIELNFTVPKEFSGGAVGQIRSLVFKGSEQGQGKALIGVPVQITEGRFILALNNLESAQKTNVALIENSSWIDVPMLYRTGRRAFITIEKGAPGEKIFKEVFEAWGK